MTTEGGGWTLMLAYNHKGGSDTEIDSTQLPTDPAGNSHMDLK
jgi:hypothetical protein